MAHQVEPDGVRAAALQALKERAVARLAEPPTSVLHLPKGQHPQGGEQATDVEAAEVVT
jgi:hypothetical protein